MQCWLALGLRHFTGQRLVRAGLQIQFDRHLIQRPTAGSSRFLCVLHRASQRVSRQCCTQRSPPPDTHWRRGGLLATRRAPSRRNARFGRRHQPVHIGQIRVDVHPQIQQHSLEHQSCETLSARALVELVFFFFFFPANGDLGDGSVAKTGDGCNRTPRLGFCDCDGGVAKSGRRKTPRRRICTNFWGLRMYRYADLCFTAAVPRTGWSIRTAHADC